MIEKFARSIRRRLDVERRARDAYEIVSGRRWEKYHALEWRIQGFVRKPRQVIFVDPWRITRMAELRPNGQIDHEHRPRDVITGRRVAGMILNDTDILSDSMFEEHFLVKACEARWIGGMKWEDTAYGSHYAVYVAKGFVKDWDEFAATRLRRWDMLFRDMCEGHYRLSRDPLDEVQVAVDNEGEVLFCDGKHRLVAARILGYQSIPVIVNFWSRGFLDRIGANLTPREMVGAIRGGQDAKHVVLGRRESVPNRAERFSRSEP